MGKVIKFPIKEIETQDETATAADMVKAIKAAYSDAELEAIRLELEGYDEDEIDSNETLN